MGKAKLVFGLLAAAGIGMAAGVVPNPFSSKKKDEDTPPITTPALVSTVDMKNTMINLFDNSGKKSVKFRANLKAENLTKVALQVSNLAVSFMDGPIVLAHLEASEPITVQPLAKISGDSGFLVDDPYKFLKAMQMGTFKIITEYTANGKRYKHEGALEITKDRAYGITSFLQKELPGFLKGLGSTTLL